MSSEQPCESLDRTWSAIRDSVAQNLLSNDSVPVPDLSNANHFGLFSIFVKHQPDSIGQKLKSSLTSPSYQVIGHISQVIQLDKTDLDRLLNSANPHIEDTTHIKKWEKEVDMGNKSVRIIVEGLSKFVISLNMEIGDLHLKTDIPELVGAKNIYIITDVVKASVISGVVMGDDDSWERVSINSRPIGFRYSKFRLTSDGVVAEQVKSKLNFQGKWNVIVDRIKNYLNVLPD